MSVEHFLDTNVFIYVFDETDDEKRESAERLIRQGVERETGCISYQVVQETINILTRKLNVPTEKVRQILDYVLIPLWRINPTQTLYRRGLDLQARYKFSFYDSLIIAAALDAGCKTLYSEDFQHGQRIEQLTIVNPFSTPADA